MNKFDKVFINFVEDFGKLSNCQSYKVGSCIVIDNRIIVSGYNGTPQGYINCDEFIRKTLTIKKWLNIEDLKDHDSELRKIHADFSDKYEIHSEINNLIWAARKGLPIEGGTLYCTYHPCWNCSKAIIAAKIKRVVYKYEYDRINNKTALDKFYSDCNVLKEQYKEDK